MPFNIAEGRLRTVVLALCVALTGLQSVYSAACPASLYFYAVETTDDREIFSRQNATSFEDCVKKCYASDFCFSAVYTPKPGDSADCRLSYVAAYNCSYKVLVNTYSNPNRPATAECIRCPALGEFISPPVTVSPVGGTQAPNSGTPAHNVETVGPSQGTKAPEKTAQTQQPTTTKESTPLTFEVEEIDTKEFDDLHIDNTTFINVNDVAECAALCYRKRCSFAIYSRVLQEKVSARCFLNFNGTQVCAGSGRISSYTPTREANVLIQCPLLKSVIIEPPPTSVTKPETETAAITAVPRACTKVLTYNLLSPTKKDIAEYDNHTEAVSVDDCAKQCYSRGCTIAGFIPPKDKSIAVGNCLMYFGQDDCSNEKQFTNADTQKDPVEIHCIKCVDQTNAPTTVPTTESVAITTTAAPTTAEPTTVAATPEPTTIVKETSTPPATTTAKSTEGGGQLLPCLDIITYETKQPSTDRVYNFSETVGVSSAAKCVQACYQRRCTVAEFIHDNSGGSEHSCSLGYFDELCNVGVSRTSNYSGPSPVEFHCVRCDKRKEPHKVTTVSSRCLGALSFELYDKRHSNNRSINYVDISATATYQDCLQKCYRKRCTIASFEIAKLKGKANSCLLSYDQRFNRCAYNSTDRLYAYNGTSPVEFQCVDCGEAVIVEPPISITSGVVETIGTQKPTSTKAPIIETTTVEVTATTPTPTPSSTAPTTEVQVATNATETSSVATTQTPITTAAPTTIQAETTAPSTNATTTIAETTVDTTKKPSINVVAGTLICDEPVTFSVLQPDPSREIPFNLTVSTRTDTVAQCAQRCFEQNCSVAGYLPSEHSCVFAFNFDVPCQNLESLNNYTTTTAVQIQCVNCGKPKILNAIEATPGSVNKETTVDVQVTSVITATQNVTTVEPAETTGVTTATPAFTGGCVVYFQMSEINRTFAGFPFYDVFSQSASGCAHSCYLDGCTVAQFIPISTDDGTKKGNCRMFYQDVENFYSCNTNNPEIAYYKPREPIQIQCLRCTNVYPTLTLNNFTNNRSSLLKNNDATKLTHFNGTEPTLPSVVRHCDGSLKFEATIRQPTEVFTYDYNLTAPTANDCAMLCYQRSCSSALFAPPTNNSYGQCQMNFRDYVCPRNPSLVSSFSTDEESILKCFACDDQEETPGMVTVVQTESTHPPVLNVTAVETTVASGTLVTAVSNNTRECNGVLNFDVGNTKNIDLASMILVLPALTADECAQSCYKRFCQIAAFEPSESGTTAGKCHMNFTTNEKCTEGRHLLNHYETVEPVRLVCMTCVASAIEVTPSTINKNGSANPVQGIANCRSVAFEAVSPDPQKLNEFVNHSFAYSASECALLCYKSRCTSAGFMGVTANTGDPAVCLLSFADPICLGVPKVGEYNATGSIQLQCIECSATYESGQSTSAPPVSSEIPVTTGAPVIAVDNATAFTRVVTVQPQEGCKDTLFYQLSPVASSFVSQSDTFVEISVANIETCAAECYKSKCTAAVFRPAISSSQNNVCAMDLQGSRTNCFANHTSYSWHYEGSESVLMQCVICENLDRINQAASPAELMIVKSEDVYNYTRKSEDQTKKDCVIVYDEFEPKTVGNSAEYSLQVPSAAACAKECYIYECSEAYFIPTNTEPGNYTGRCLLLFGESNCTVETPKVAFHNPERPLRLSCVRCIENFSGYLSSRGGPNQAQTKQTPPFVVETSTPRLTTIQELLTPPVLFFNETTATIKVEPTDINVTKSENVRETTLPDTLTFETPRPLNETTIPDTLTFVTASPLNQTTLPEFLTFETPSELNETTKPDTLTFVTASPLSETTLPDLLTFETPSALNETIAPSKESTTPAVESSSPTSGGGQEKTKICPTAISFQMGDPSDDNSINYTTNVSGITNGYDCAQKCYERAGCRFALFTADFTNTGSAPPATQCQLSLSSVADKCTSSNSGQGSSKNTVRLQCIRCSSENIEPAPVTAVKPEVTQGATTVVIVQTNSTERFVTGGGFDLSSTSLSANESLPTTAGINVETSSSRPFPTLPAFANTTDTVTIENLNVTRSQEATTTSFVETTLSTLIASIANATQALIGVETSTGGTTAEITPGARGPRSECNNRLIFQVQQIKDLSTFTTYLKAASAADCARTCYNQSCEKAAYIPPPEGLQAGVCILSKNSRQCQDNTPKVAQEYGTYPFVIDCIECSTCTFSLRTPNPERAPKYEIQETANSMVECAQKCSKNKCASAAYTGRTSGNGTCLISLNGAENCETAVETRVETNDNLPVILDCVRCQSS